MTSVLNCVPRVLPCPTCLMCLRALRAYMIYVLMCLTYLRAFVHLLLACIERLTKSQRSWQQMVFFPVRQLGVFSTGQMKFFCWVQEIGTMLLQRCCNISDAKIALQQLYYSQLWQAVCQFFTIFFRRYLTGYSCLTDSRQTTKD